MRVRARVNVEEGVTESEFKIRVREYRLPMGSAEVRVGGDPQRMELIHLRVEDKVQS